MNTPDWDELEDLLIPRLEKDYPDLNIELGEYWEVIAEIFYKLGWEACAKQEADKLSLFLSTGRTSHE